MVCSYHSSDFIWTECTVTGHSHGELSCVLWSDPVCCGYNQSQCTPFRWNKVRWDNVRWVIWTLPQNWPSPFDGLYPHLIHPSLDRPHSPLQMTSRSNQLFYHNSPTGPTDWQMGKVTSLCQNDSVNWNHWMELNIVTATRENHPLDLESPSVDLPADLRGKWCYMLLSDDSTLHWRRAT